MRRWLRSIALALALPFAVGVARAAEPAPLIFDAPAPAPAKSAPLIWRTPDLSTPGYFYTDEQVKKLANRLVTLEDLLAQEKVATARKQADADLAKAGFGVPKWVWITAGLVTGAAIGVGVGYAAWGR